MKTLAIDEQWSVTYDPESDNKMTGFVFHGQDYRLDQVVGTDSVVKAMFNALFNHITSYTTLFAKNATLRAERDEGVRLLENARQIERNVQSVREYEHKRAEAAIADIATLRASEAAALERIRQLENLLQMADKLANDYLISSGSYSGFDEPHAVQTARQALTHTADKEPKT